MTDQYQPRHRAIYRAHLAHWEAVIKRSQGPGDDYLASVIRELMERVHALETTQHAHADLSRLSGAEQDRMAQELAKPAAWRPLETEITCGSEAAAATAQQILRAPVVVVEGAFVHGGETYRFKAKPERKTAMDELRAASAEARPTVKESLTDGGSLVERVATIITLANTSRGGAEIVLSEVAAAARLRDLNGQSVAVLTWEMVAQWLEQEADRG